MRGLATHKQSYHDLSPGLRGSETLVLKSCRSDGWNQYSLVVDWLWWGLGAVSRRSGLE